MPKTITIPRTELWDKEKEEFVYKKEQVIVLEHSLVSLSKWESKWHKPFLSSDTKTTEEILDYIKCMTITQNVDPEVYLRLTQQNVKEINEYIEDPATATWFGKREKKPGINNKVVTSELIYYWMIALQIPWEAQKWHLNRLITLIKVCNEENRPKKNMNMNDVYRRNSALNAARRSKYHSKG